jgi:hypothetical protein
VGGDRRAILSVTEPGELFEALRFLRKNCAQNLFASFDFASVSLEAID